MGNEVNKCMGVEKLTDNRFLNLYHIDARSASGQPFDYYFASRNDADNIKIKTKEVRPEGIVIYPVLKDEPDKVVMIRQYRYPLDAYIYEFPAGCIDPGSTLRSMRVEMTACATRFLSDPALPMRRMRRYLAMLPEPWLTRREKIRRRLR